MPKLHAYYDDTLKALANHNPLLKRIFPTSVFSVTTYKLGPRTASFKYTDFANLSFKLYVRSNSIGKFRTQKGGHLILCECGLVVEFLQVQPSSSHRQR